MAETYKILAQGEIGTVSGALYTVPGATSAIIKSIVIINQTAAAITVTLWINGTTDPFLWLPSTTSIPANGMIEWEGSLALAAAEVINGDTATGNTLTFTISGVEIT